MDTNSCVKVQAIVVMIPDWYTRAPRSKWSKFSSVIRWTVGWPSQSPVWKDSKKHNILHGNCGGYQLYTPVVVRCINDWEAVAYVVHYGPPHGRPAPRPMDERRDWTADRSTERTVPGGKRKHGAALRARCGWDIFLSSCMCPCVPTRGKIKSHENNEDYHNGVHK